jgi:hypothetical protein
MYQVVKSTYQRHLSRIHLHTPPPLGQEAQHQTRQRDCASDCTVSHHATTPKGTTDSVPNGTYGTVSERAHKILCQIRYKRYSTRRPTNYFNNRRWTRYCTACNSTHARTVSHGAMHNGCTALGSRGVTVNPSHNHSLAVHLCKRIRQDPAVRLALLFGCCIVRLPQAASRADEV